MNKFVFEDYHFDRENLSAVFRYRFQTGGMEFQETVQFDHAGDYDEDLLDKALFLSFILVGTSYYKLFPSSEVELLTGALDDWQVDFFNRVYQEGMSQFAYENKLTRDDLAHFAATSDDECRPVPYAGKGIISLQSGGKDSLLTATLLRRDQHTFTPWYVTSTAAHHPGVLDTLGSPLRTALRRIDKDSLQKGIAAGGLNGHVPVTYIISSFALVEAILTGADTVLLSIGHEGEEPHGWIGDLPVNHQWSKTFPAEQELAEYVTRYISPDLHIGSPLRGNSELRIAELFVKNAWAEFGHVFSSCNRANYEQGVDNTVLRWCGECSKCANSYLLFAPFLPASELNSLFHDQDLFAKPMLQETFKGLLGVDGVMKPFECVGEIDELRLAYHKAQARGGYAVLPFDVPSSEFDYLQTYPHQEWARELL